MASLNLAGKTSGYVKLQAPDDSSSNPTVTLPTESGELALKSDSIWTEVDGKAVYDGDGMSVSVDGSEVLKIASDETLMTSYDGQPAFRIASNGSVRFPETVNFPLQGTANVYIDGNGRLHRATYTPYTTEEVDKKLAAKDKLIEKLSERLDSLEKKLKK